MKYKADYDEYIKIKRVYNSNQIQACALLWERCAKIMPNKISAQVDFVTQIYGNPVELFKAVREHVMDYQATKYEMSIIIDAFNLLLFGESGRKASLDEN